MPFKYYLNASLITVMLFPCNFHSFYYSLTFMRKFLNLFLLQLFIFGQIEFIKVKQKETGIQCNKIFEKQPELLISDDLK